MSNFEAVIGLEVHAQLSTNSKIFCGPIQISAKRPFIRQAGSIHGIFSIMEEAHPTAVVDMVVAGNLLECPGFRSGHGVS